MESVLKTVLGRDSGNASTLIRNLADNDFYSDVPDEVARAFGEQILMALPFLRNKLGGHGQGGEVVNVPKHYAELAVHLAASYILFIVQKTIDRVSSQEETPESATQAYTPTQENDIPF